MPGSRVLIVDERRLLAVGLAYVLEARPGVREAAVLQDLTALPAALASGWDVVVSSEAYALHALRIAPSETRVLVVVQQPHVERVAALLSQGIAGVCTPRDRPIDVADAVEQVAAGEMRLPGDLVQPVLLRLQEQRSRAMHADEVLAGLTSRERDVLVGLGQGRGRAEIGRDLGLSPHTVRTHVQHLLRKLSLHSQLEAGALARELQRARGPAVPAPSDAPVILDLDGHKGRRSEAARSSSGGLGLTHLQ